MMELLKYGWQRTCSLVGKRRSTIQVGDLALLSSLTTVTSESRQSFFAMPLPFVSTILGYNNTVINTVLLLRVFPRQSLGSLISGQRGRSFCACVHTCCLHVMADQSAHRSGPLKQQNKPHKHGKHRTKGNIQANNKGT